MRKGRLTAVGATGALLGALMGWIAQPAFAQDADPGASAEAPAGAPADTSAEAPATSAKPRKRQSAPPRTGASAKPAASTNAAPAGAPSAPDLTPSGKPPVTSAEVRPPADMLVDCAKAPKDAVTRLPDDLARWATVYCTKMGGIFNANDQHFGAFPDSGLRASFSAADMADKPGDAASAYFSKIGYRQLSPAESDALIARDPSIKRILVGKSLWQLDLTANNGASLSFIAIDPSADLFWVFPLQNGGIGSPAFYVTSLAALNRAR